MCSRPPPHATPPPSQVSDQRFNRQVALWSLSKFTATQANSVKLTSDNNRLGSSKGAAPTYPFCPVGLSGAQAPPCFLTGTLARDQGPAGQGAPVWEVTEQGLEPKSPPQGSEDLQGAEGEGGERPPGPAPARLPDRRPRVWGHAHPPRPRLRAILER